MRANHQHPTAQAMTPRLLQLALERVDRAHGQLQHAQQLQRTGHAGGTDGAIQSAKSTLTEVSELLERAALAR